MKTFLFTLFALVALALPASAQTPPDVKNPTKVEFNCSADHAKIDGYEVDIMKKDGTLVQTLSFLGTSKPTPSISNVCTLAMNVQPIDFGTGYFVNVRAKAGTAVSDNAKSVNSFDRSPLDVSNVIVK